MSTCVFFELMLSGKICAVNGFTVSPPESVSSAKHYIPKLGGKPYIPPSSLKGRHRRAAFDLIMREAPNCPSNFYEIAGLRSGYVAGKREDYPSNEVYTLNPFLEAYGRWKSTARFCLDASIFHDAEIRSIRGVRRDEVSLISSLDYLSVEGQAQIAEILQGAEERREGKKAAKAAKSEGKVLTDEEKELRGNQGMGQPWEYQVVPPGAIADFKAGMTTSSNAAKGLVLAAWEEYGNGPAMVGGHNANHGMISVDITIHERKIINGQLNIEEIGHIKTNNNKDGIPDPMYGITVSGPCRSMIDEFRSKMAAGDFDFGAGLRV